MPSATPKLPAKNGVPTNAPTGWQVVPLGGIAEIASGITLGRPLRDKPTRRVPYLRVANVKDGWLDLDDVYEIDATDEEIKKCRLRYGDILLTEGGDPDKLGRGTFWQEQIAECVHQNHIFRVRLPSDRFCYDFVSLQIGSPHGKAYFFAQAKQTTGIATINRGVLNRFPLLVPPLPEQRRIAAHLREQLAGVAQARAATEAQADGLGKLIHALLRESLSSRKAIAHRLADCLSEVSEGVGEKWEEYPVLGATRAGLAMAKEPVGKNPGRYKPVRPGTIFYNPMRILLGSIAMIDDENPPGITSPDYVAMRCIEGHLHPRRFYYWFRSRYGAEFIKSMTRGAVRERLMFRRLAPASISIPDWPTQVAVAAKLVEIKQAKLALAVKLTALERLPAALLREAFSGRI